MNTARRSMAEDEVDRYNHTLVVYLLLLVAVATWLLPLSLMTLPSGDVSPPLLESSPGFIGNCWCPAQFEESHVAYTNAVCTSAFNKVIRDAVSGESNETLRYETLLKGLRSLMVTAPGEVTENKIQDTSENKNERTISEQKHFIFVRTPLILFALALCLKLPHVAWGSVSNFTGLGFSHLLESARAAQLLDAGVRSQFKDELKKVVGIIKQSSYFSCVLYLLLKVVTLLVTLTGLFIVSYNLLPQAESFRKDLDQRASAVTPEAAVSRRYSGISLHCYFDIRQVTNVHQYLVQCTFSPSNPSSTESSIDKELALIWLYESIFTVLLLLFAVLATVNVISLLTWAVRLAPGSPCKKVFRKAGYPADTYLLLYMANLNAGPLVSSCLEQCLNEEAPGEKSTREELKNLCD